MLLVGFLNSTQLYAQGGTCGGATSITINGACDNGNINNTVENNPLITGCTGTFQREGWYTFTVTGGPLDVTITANSGNRNLYLQLISSTSACTALTQISCANADNANNTAQTETINATLSDGIYYIKVVNVGSQNQNMTLSSLCVTAAPTISSFTPTVACAGDNVIITGVNFVGITAVTFNGVAATSYTVNSSTQITAVVPNVTSGPIEITNGGGTGTSPTNITINPLPSITLSSATGTNNQTTCRNTAITNITYNIGGGATGVTLTGTLPAGVTGTLAAGVYTISGTPTATGTFNYTLTTTGGSCPSVNTTGTITVNQIPSIVLASAAATTNQTICINTALTNITYTVSGSGTGATVTGLPSGVNGNFSGTTFTISGTPTAAGTFNYTVTTTGGLCPAVALSGTITVRPSSTMTLTSAAGTNNQTVCRNTAITNIAYTIGGSATGVTLTGALPAGVTGTLTSGVYTISGTPTATGTFNYTVTTTGGCTPAVALSGTIIVNQIPTIALSSAAATTSQNICISTPLTNITYTVGGSGTGATVTGLPAGVNGNFSGTTFTISGTPTAAGTFNYTVTTTGGLCPAVALSGTVTVRASSTMNLTSAAGTNNQTVCRNTAITNIDYTIGGSATGVTLTGTLPAGVTGALTAGVYTISGTPTATGTFNYTVTTTGGCTPAIALTGTIVVNQIPTIVLASAAATTNQTICMNTVLTNIRYTIGGSGTGATVTGLPTGITGSFAGTTFTISGTPTVAGTFNYTVTTTGGLCPAVALSGTITVTPLAAMSLTSAAGTNNQTVCRNTAITNIVYTIGGSATGVTFTGTLPTGVTGVFAAGVYTISGTPTGFGVFNYTLTTTGGCSPAIIENGTITVNDIPTIALSSAAATTNQTICMNTPLTDITYNIGGSATGATVTGLPAGINGNYAAGVFTINGTPTAAGTFNYTVTTTGGLCPAVALSGTITVTPLAAMSLTSAASTNNQTVCRNTAITNIDYTIGGSATGVTFTGILPIGVTGVFAAGVYTISGTPTGFGVFNYTLTTTGGCSPAIVENGTITVNDIPTITLSSAAATTNQTICMNTPLTDITYNIGGSATGATVIGLPAGINGNYAAGVFTINGTPTAAGTFNYTVTTTGGLCPAVALSGTITVTPLAAMSLTSAPATTNQTTCTNTAITNITYAISGSATGATVTGLPAGINGNYAGGVFTISGTPTGFGVFNYTVSTTGGCAPVVTAFGTITVNQIPTITLTSAAATTNQTICINTPATNITYNVGGSGTGATVTGLPTGVNGVYLAGVFTISGTPTVAGTFNYTVTTSGGLCTNAIATGTIIVRPLSTISLTSAAATTNQTTCTNTAITNITYAIGGSATGATVTGLPAGINGNYAGGVFTISGTPTGFGVFNYTVSTTGGCLPVVTASGTITVNQIPTITLTSAAATTNQTICINTPATNITYNIGGSAIGASVTGLPTGISGSLSGTTFTISGTPTAAGTFNYTVTTSGGLCTNATATGTIIVKPLSTIALTSGAASTNQNVCNNTAITNITYTIGGSATSATVTGLPAGTNGTYSSGVFTISGTPTAFGVFNYTVSTTGGCAPVVTATGTITVKELPTVTAISNATYCNNAAGTAINFSSSMAGSTYNWTSSANVGFGTSGSGNIAAFTATNATAATIIATVSVRATNNGCQGPASTFTITVYPTPVVNAITNLSYCNSAAAPAITFSSTTTGTTYTWTSSANVGFGTSGSGNIAAFTTANATANPIIATVTVTPTANGCPGPVRTFTVTVNPTAVVTAVSDFTYCTGVAAPAINFASTTTGVTYAWTSSANVGFGTGGSGNIAAYTTTNATAAPIIATVTVRATINGCQGPADTFTVTVNPTPVVTAITNLSYCNSVAAPAINFASTTTGTTYTWTSSADVGFGTSGSGNIPAFTTNNSTTATIVATVSVTPTANGCPGTVRTFTVTVSPAAVVTAVADFTYCTGVSAPAINFASTTAGVTYAWTSSTNVGFGTSGSGNIPSFTTLNATTGNVTATVNVRATINGCQGPIDTFTVTIYPSAVVNAITNLTYCNGVNAPAINFGSNTAGVTYDWTSSVNVGFGTSGSGNIAAFTATNATTASITTTVTVRATINGCQGPARTFTITVNPSPVVNAISNLTYCNSVAAPAITFSSTTSGVTYAWTSSVNVGFGTSGTGNIGAFTTNNTTANPITTTVTVTATGTGCAGPSTTFTITVSPTALVTAISNLTYCNGVSAPAITFASTTTGVTYSWTSSANVGFGTAGTGDIPAFTASNATAAAVTATVSVRAIINGCQGTIRTFTVTVNPSPIVTAKTNLAYCNGVAAPAIAFASTTTGSVTYAWTSSVNVGFGTSGSGNIAAFTTNNTTTDPIVTTVSVTATANGCTGPAMTFTITVSPTALVTALPNLTYCAGTYAPAITFASTTAGVTYSWTNTTNVGFGTSGSGNIPAFTATNATASAITTTVSVRATINGCQGTVRTFTITVNPSPVVTAKTNLTYCHNTAAPAITFASATTGVTYAWTSTLDVGFGTSGSGNIAAYTATNPGTTAIVTTVSVTATINGCTGPAMTFTITVNPTPIITVLADYCSTGGKVELIASSNIPVTGWLWNTGETTSTILVDIAGLYTATATTGLGCSASNSISVAQELVVNGAFTSGNVGFTTGYTYYADVAGNNELVNDSGTNGYGVGTNANNYHGGFYGIDHTNNVIGPRNFMIVNGHGTITLWQQTVNVQPNTDYYFSAWAMSINAVAPYARLQFQINGVQVGSIATLTAGPSSNAQAAVNNYWTRFYSTPSWNSGAISGPITLRIVNLESALGGNDFGIDDVSFGTLSTFVILTSAVGTNAQTVCQNTPITNITYSVGSGILGPTVTGLPPGVTSSFNGVTLTLSGTPTAAGTFNYTVVTTGNCAPATATGTIVVNPAPNAPTLTITQPTCTVPTGTITITNPTGLTYSIDGTTYTNTTGIFTGLALGTYNVTAKNTLGCVSFATVATISTPNKIWNGSVDTDWNVANNWTPNGVPTALNCVTIPNVVKYPIISTADGLAYSLTILSGGRLDINPAYTLTVTDFVNVNTNGQFYLKNSSSLVQINNTANTVTGTFNMERITQGMYRYDYTYWGSPVTLASGFTLGTLSPQTLSDKYFSWTPFIGSGNGNWQYESTATVMNPNKGYIVRAPQSYSTDPNITVPYTANFVGTPNNGDISVPILVGTVTPVDYKDRMNLIGNPYPSAVDADLFLNDPTNIPLIDGTIFFWTHHSPPSMAYPNPFYGTATYNYTDADYASYNKVGGTSTVPSGYGGPPPNGSIAAGQGFFVRGLTNGTAVFKNYMREIGNNTTFFKTADPVKTENSQGIEKHRIWLNFANIQGAFNQMLVGYVEGATNGHDRDFDGTNFSGFYTSFYSINNNEKLTIQGRALPFVDTDIVDLGYKVSVANTYTIGIDHLDGLFETQNIYLEDKLLNIIHDIKQSEYSFVSEAGTFNNRFVLRYTDNLLNVTTPNNTVGVVAFVHNKKIVVQASEMIKKIQVFDIAGKLIKTYTPKSSSLKFEDEFIFADGIYISEITLENDDVVNKKLANGNY